MFISRVAENDRNDSKWKFVRHVAWQQMAGSGHLLRKPRAMPGNLVADFQATTQLLTSVHFLVIWSFHYCLSFLRRTP